MPRNLKKKEVGLHGNKNYEEIYLQRSVAALNHYAVWDTIFEIMEGAR